MELLIEAFIYAGTPVSIEKSSTLTLLLLVLVNVSDKEFIELEEVITIVYVLSEELYVDFLIVTPLVEVVGVK